MSSPRPSPRVGCVRRLPGRHVLPRAGGAASSRRGSATALITSSPNAADGRRGAAARRSQEPAVRPIRWCRAVLRLRRTRSRAAPRRSRRARSRPRELARTLGVTYLELRNSTAARPDWPRQGPLRHVPQGDRCRIAEANLPAIPRKQRAMVRKGIEARAAQRDRRDVRPLLRALRRQSCTGIGTPRLRRSAISRRCSKSSEATARC